MIASVPVVGTVLQVRNRRIVRSPEPPALPFYGERTFVHTHDGNVDIFDLVVEGRCVAVTVRSENDREHKGVRVEVTRACSRGSADEVESAFAAFETKSASLELGDVRTGVRDVVSAPTEFDAVSVLVIVGSRTRVGVHTQRCDEIATHGRFKELLIDTQDADVACNDFGCDEGLTYRTIAGSLTVQCVEPTPFDFTAIGYSATMNVREAAFRRFSFKSIVAETHFASCQWTAANDVGVFACDLGTSLRFTDAIVRSDIDVKARNATIVFNAATPIRASGFVAGAANNDAQKRIAVKSSNLSTNAQDPLVQFSFVEGGSVEVHGGA